MKPACDVTALPAWAALVRHRDAVAGLHLRELFADDPQRVRRMSIDTGLLFLDYSKNRVTGETLDLLRRLAREAGLADAVAAMFAGARINVTEDRPVLHTALRARPEDPLNGVDPAIRAAVERVKAQMRACVEDLTGGRLRGATGKPITDLVSIGIGGSHLGPLLATRALAHRNRSPLRLHFVANLDPRDIDAVLARVDPAAALFIIASKSFTTLETCTNAATVRRWLEERLPAGADAGAHFAAVTANAAAARELGIAASRIFEFWDWVGGRYSLWSAIGLPVAAALGMDGFEEMLDGARAMDLHFREAPLEENLPVTLALLGVWYTNFLGAETHAVVPYDQRLELLPDYLQQLDMESNGKRVTREGRPVPCATAPVLWGGIGTNAQHAFFQLLHQGTRLVPVDFIAVLDPEIELPPHHELLIANCFAQARALMWGRTEEEARAELTAAGHSETDIARLLPHRVFPGNAPSNTLLLPRLTPRSFGALLAAYEHKTFVQGVLWGINSFDQWGVELGKHMARAIERGLAGAAEGQFDASTAALMARYRAARRRH